jgi:hypothetical protein
LNLEQSLEVGGVDVVEEDDGEPVVDVTNLVVFVRGEEAKCTSAV